MKKFSNRYIFLYISIFVILVALLLGMASLWLQPFQKANRDNEEKKQVLRAVGYELDKSTDVASLFALVANADTLSSKNNNSLLLYYTVKTPQEETAFVIPLVGKGLWGPIWGYIAVADDGKTLVGAVFAHKSETPGLGAQISTSNFSSTFRGKLLFDDQGNFVSIKVVKGGVLNSRVAPEHGVDAITGGTITSRGVEEMIYHSLLPYVSFLKAQALRSPTNSPTPGE